VRDTCRELGWRVSDRETGWDLLWTDNAVEADLLGRMQQHQKVNHFPGMFALSRKNQLARGLLRMRRAFPCDYSFYPDTWLVPADLAELRSNMKAAARGKVRTYIAKPEASCQGRGIFLTRSLSDLDPH
jgi:tubulin polyglutamylase TTLL6/13